MTAIRVSLLTIESDSADPTIMAALRDLLERAGVGSVSNNVVMTAPPATPATASLAPEARRTRAKPEAPAVAAAPKPTVERAPCRTFPPCRNCRDGGGACLSTVKPARVVVDAPATVALQREAHASTRLDGETHVVEPASLSAVVAELQGPVLALLERRPGLSPTALAKELLNDTSQGSLIRMGRVLNAMARAELVERAGREGTWYRAGSAPAARPPGRPPRETAPALRLTEEQLANRMPDFGRVQGTATQPIAPGSLSERVVKAVLANPGVTVQEIARELLDRVDGEAVRRIDMLVGPLTMSGQVARFNGRLYRDTKQAAELKLPAPQRQNDLRRPGSGQAPLQRVQDAKDIFDRIVAAFAEDHATPVPDLARELFGASTGHSVSKLQLFLRQLCASKRLQSLGSGSYRPITEADRAEAEEEDADDDRDEDDIDDDEPELVSNGHPDDEEPQELDVG